MSLNRQILRPNQPEESPSTDSSALGILDTGRQAGREQDFAIVGQHCIHEVIQEIRTGKSAIVGSISHEVENYGPRLIQLGIALLRGYTIPPTTMSATKP